MSCSAGGGHISLLTGGSSRQRAATAAAIGAGPRGDAPPSARPRFGARSADHADRVRQRGDHLAGGGETLSRHPARSPCRRRARGAPADPAAGRANVRRVPDACARQSSSKSAPATGCCSVSRKNKQHADGVDVAGDRRRMAGEEFRRHVRRRAAGESSRSPSCVSPKSISRIRPPSSRITLPALMSRCRSPAAWTAAGRLADVDADERRFACAERALGVDELRERPAEDEIAPEADAPVVPVDAVDRARRSGDGPWPSPSLRAATRSLPPLDPRRAAGAVSARRGAAASDRTRDRPRQTSRAPLAAVRSNGPQRSNDSPGNGRSPLSLVARCVSST